MGSRTRPSVFYASVFYTCRYGGRIASDLSRLFGGAAAANGRADRNLSERVDGRADLGAVERERECHRQPGAALERQCAAVDCFGRRRAAGHAPTRRGIRGAGGLPWRGTGGKVEGVRRGSGGGHGGSDARTDGRADCGAALRRDSHGGDLPRGGALLGPPRPVYFRHEDADGDCPGVFPAPARGGGTREEDAVEVSKNPRGDRRQKAIVRPTWSH